MSQSPEQSDAVSDHSTYLQNWDALGTLISRGRSFSGSERNCCFLNLRNSNSKPTHHAADGTKIRDSRQTPWFADVSAASQFDLIDDCRGIATVDWDHDGDLDIWLSSRTAPGIHYLQNGLESRNRSIAVKLQGTTCNRDAIGARVEVYLHTENEPDRCVIKTVRAGDAFVSQATKWLHFGLKEGASIGRVSVYWPGTRVAEVFSLTDSHRRFRLVQGSGQAVPEIGRSKPIRPLTREPIKKPEVDSASRVVLTRRRELPTIAYVDFSGNPRTIETTHSAPTLLTLWASWCQPCLHELQSLHENRSLLQDAGIQVLALSIDGIDDGTGPNDPKQAAARIRDMGFRLPAGVATKSALQSLQRMLFGVFYREKPLQVPISFLLDERGYVSIIYRGQSTPAQTISDARLLSSDDAQRVEVELYPLGGRSALGMLATDRLGFARAYYEGGYYEDSCREVLQFLARTRNRLEDTPSLETERKLAEAYHHLAKTLDSLGKPEEAIQAYRSAMKLMPAALGSRISLATILWNQGRFSEAEQELEHAQRHGDGSVKFYHLLARTRMQFGQTRRAVANYQRVMELRPGDTVAQLELAVALESDGQTGLAIQQYRLLLDKQPHLHAAANNLAWIHATQDNTDYRDGAEALRLAHFVCQATNYSRAAYLDTLAAASAELGQFEQAVQVGEKAVKLATEAQLDSLAREIMARVAMYRKATPFRTRRINE